MRKQDVVLKYQPNAPAFGRNMPSGSGIVEHLAVELDVTLDRNQAGQRAQQRRLARAIRAEDGYGFACRDEQIDLEEEAVLLDSDASAETHGAPRLTAGRASGRAAR